MKLLATALSAVVATMVLSGCVYDHYGRYGNDRYYRGYGYNNYDRDRDRDRYDRDRDYDRDRYRY
ncbi:MAG TPA: hypothetical protein VNH44_08490 [Micropepsaceae bacterium]|nr:hypothetical protein [Micropepsaceae bacterium]